MAKTFYKYAEREADAYVNWAEIGQNMTDMFKEENRVREEKKAALDQASRTLMQEIANKPMGEHESANMASMDLAETISKNNLMQKSAMERGEINPNDYMKFTQNSNDNIKIAYNSLQNYQENFKESMAGVQAEKYSGLQLEAGAHAEKFGEWKNVGWVLDAKGNLMMGVKKTEVIDGKTVTTLDQSPGNLTSVQALNEGLKARIPMAKIEEESAKIVAALGKDIRTTIVKSGLHTTGAVVTTEDILAKKYGEKETGALFEFFTAENQYIKTLAGPPEKQASILFDKKRVASNGLPYTTTYSEEEARRNPNLILKVYNSTNGRDEFKISDAQEKEIEDFLRNTLRRQYDYEEKATVVSQLDRNDEPQYIADADADLKKNINTTTMIGSLYAAPDGASLTKAAQAFRDINPNIQSFTRTPNGLSVTLFGPNKTLETRDISFYGEDGSLLTQEEFILSAAPLLAGNIDAKTAIQKGGLIKGGKFNDKLSAKAVVQQEAKAEDIDYTTDVENYTAKNTKAAIKTDEATQTAANLTKLYGRLNFTFEAVEEGFDDNIIIIAPDKTKSAPIPVDNLDNISTINQFIIDKSAGQNYDKVWPYRKKQLEGGSSSGSVPSTSKYNNE